MRVPHAEELSHPKSTRNQAGPTPAPAQSRQAPTAGRSPALQSSLDCTTPPRPPSQCANSVKCLSGDTVQLKLDGLRMRQDPHSKCGVAWTDWVNSWIGTGGLQARGPCLGEQTVPCRGALSGDSTRLANTGGQGPPRGPGPGHPQRPRWGVLDRLGVELVLRGQRGAASAIPSTETARTKALPWAPGFKLQQAAIRKSN